MATKPIPRKERHTEHGAPMSRSHLLRTVGQRPRYDWRGDVRVASGLNVLAGVWLIISAAVLNYRADDPLWNDYLFGGAIALLAGIRAAGAFRQSWMSRLNLLIGAWLFGSAFWLYESSAATVNNIFLGMMVAMLAIWSASATDERPGTARTTANRDAEGR